jgi:hypothetical protein
MKWYHPTVLNRQGKKFERGLATRHIVQVMKRFSMIRKGENRDLFLVLAGCTAIFALNLTWLLWVRHSNPDQLRSIGNFALLIQLKRLLLQPMSLLVTLAVFTSWVIAFVRSRRERQNKTFDLIFIALVLSTLFGLVLFFIFVP